MPLVHRVLPERPVASVDEYVALGGGEGLGAARRVEPTAVIDELVASGLRGRGGAGFPTGVKWRTVLENASPTIATTVVVNAAEGEPGTFKDRAILRANPYQVIEGALIAAHAVGAPQVVFALKSGFTREVERLRSAILELEAKGLADGVELTVFEGPGEYLYGEETALLEAVAGRAPFPRIAPPYRRGVIDVTETAEPTPESGLPSDTQMATPGGATDEPPALVNNVETLANVPAIVRRGAAWFRELGTERSPGTIVCTVVGAVGRAGVGEVPMGTTLREAIAMIGGGARRGREIVGVLQGVSSAIVPAEALDTPLTYEDMQRAGGGLGSAGFYVIDDGTDPVALVAGASRFLAVESCGQCIPCKSDGLAMSELLGRIARSEADEHDVEALREHTRTVDAEARCYLATQHQLVVGSLLERFPDAVAAHVAKDVAPVEPVVLTGLLDIDGDGVARWDDDHARKQPDWTVGDTWSGDYPSEQAADHRARR